MKLKNNFLIPTLSIFLMNSIHAAETKTWSLESADAKYLAKHIAHNTHAESKTAKGKIKCDKECDALIAIEVKTFDSGNTNRDLHMQKITNAASVPYVTLKLHGPKDIKTWNKDNITAKIDFAGQTNDVKFNELKVSATDSKISTEAKFQISLTQFKVDRPSLLGVPVDDLVELEVKGDWKN